ncbi:MAG TPA: glycosyltransferase family 9 protein [Bryobacteraceae bacterium]|jgi:heptosyltransferase-1|nr:glycosyltransferase family 9 protein [Bryobacteraceae bacterium]
MSAAGQPVNSILIVRLGAMGDIIHTLPAAASLRASFPSARIAWVVEPRWAPLLEENASLDRVIAFQRDGGGFRESVRRLRAEHYDVALDFQGLIKSAVVARLARASRVLGYGRGVAREGAATLLYSRTIGTQSAHVVDMRLDLAAAAGARDLVRAFPLPEGHPEGELPKGDFVLASPMAGWRSKQWPIEYYSAILERLRNELGMALVLNGPPSAEAALRGVPGAWAHVSGIPGLIHATRRATAVIGVDSGPLHLAAAMHKPGVAIFGPTDPVRNGPYCDSLQVLRAPDAPTTYKRGVEIDLSMRQVLPDLVFDALKAACLA